MINHIINPTFPGPSYNRWSIGKFVGMIYGVTKIKRRLTPLVGLTGRKSVRVTEHKAFYAELAIKESNDYIHLETI